jgi:hypothetical protein
MKVFKGEKKEEEYERRDFFAGSGGFCLHLSEFFGDSGTNEGRRDDGD